MSGKGSPSWRGVLASVQLVDRQRAAASARDALIVKLLEGSTVA